MKKFLLSLAAVAALGFTANAESVKFDFAANDYGLDRWNSEMSSVDGYQGYIAPGTTIKSDIVSITLSGSTEITANNSGYWRLWTDGLRAYYKWKPTFTVKVEGYNVTGVEWTYKELGLEFALEGTENAITAWGGNLPEVTFTCINGSANRAFTTITVYYDETFTPEPEPEVPSFPNETMSVSQALDLMNQGARGKATVEGYIVKIDEINTQYGNATYWIADSADETENLLEVYRGKGLNGDLFTSASDLSVGAFVVVTGELVDYNGTFEFTTGSTLLSYDGEEGDNPEVEAIFYESFASSLGDFSTIYENPVDGINNVWAYAKGYGAKASGYFNLVNYAVEGWLVSPEIDLAGYTEIVLNFEHAINFWESNVKNYCQVYVGEAGTDVSTSWTNLTNSVVYPESQSWTFVNSGDVSLNAFAGKKIQIGFYYASTEEVAPTWEIKNLIVAEPGDNNAVEAIGSDVNAPAVFYNLQGLRVANPVKGQIYIVNGKKVIF